MHIDPINETLVGALRGRYIRIGALFDQYGAAPSAKKRLFALAICDAISNNQAVERQMLYPGLRQENAMIARSLRRVDREMSARIAAVRVAGDEGRDAAVVHLMESFRRKVWTHERSVFSNGQWRIPPAWAGAPDAEALRSA